MYPKHFLDYFREFETTDEVFVAMPFGEEAAERRWEYVFVPAIKAVDLEPYRVDARDVGDSILTDILEGIGRARLVLGDVSDQGVTELVNDRVRRPNPNAVYELGIAHAARLETEVVIVRAEPEEDEEERVPFDLLHIRHHTFDPGDPEAADFVAGLLSGALEEIDRTRDLVVERTMRVLDSETLRMLEKHVVAEGDYNYQDLRPTGMGQRMREAIHRLLDLGILRREGALREEDVGYSLTPLGDVIVAEMEDPIR